MGTNYYAEEYACRCCGRNGGRVHVMKSFRIFQGFTEDNPTQWGPVRSWADWRDIIHKHDLRIFDEYGEEHDNDEFVDSIDRIPADQRRRSYDQHVTEYGNRGHDYLDPAGYWFTDEDFS